MKVLAFFAYCFGSILIVFALGLFGLWLAPQTHVLDGEPLSYHSGRLKNPDRVFPGFREKVPFGHTGAEAGLSGSDGRVKFRLLVCADEKAAKALFSVYSKTETSNLNGTQSAGQGYRKYRQSGGGPAGEIRRVGPAVVHIQGENPRVVAQAFDLAGFMIPNPKRNVLTDIYFTSKYTPRIFVFLLLYVVLQVPIWPRLASWAATVPPRSDASVVGVSELRGRLLAINRTDTPLHVIERENGVLDVTWRLVDAKWLGLMSAHQVKFVEILRLKLSEDDRTCRAVNISKRMEAHASILDPGFSFTFTAKQGITFWQWQYEKQYGLTFKDGGLAFDTTYEYKFDLEELRQPVIAIVLAGGWRYKPVLVLWRILGG